MSTVGEKRLALNLLPAALLAAALLLPPAPVVAAVDMGGKATTDVFSDKEIEELIVLTGQDATIASMPSLTTMMVTVARPNLTDGQRFDLSQILNNGTIADVLFSSVRADIRNKLDAAAVKEIKAWFSGPVGKRVMLVERAMSSAENAEKMQAYIAKGAANAQEFDRAQLLRELDVSTRATDTQLLILHDRVSILRKMTQNTELLKQAEQAAANASRDLDANIGYAMYFIYTGISDDDLRAYLAFYKSPAGQKWVDVIRGLSRTMWRTINQTAVDFLRRLEQQAPVKP